MPRTHGQRSANTPAYLTWRGMKERCHNKRHKSYPAYGGAGIWVCDEWRASFMAFFADMGPRPEGHTLDRIDPSKGYYKANCRWADKSTQEKNKRGKR